MVLSICGCALSGFLRKQICSVKLELKDLR